MIRRWLALLLLILLGACAEAHDRGPGTEVVPGAPTAAHWLQQAQLAHQRADRAADRPAKRASLEALAMLAQAWPRDAIDSSDASATRQDLYARSAQLALDLGLAPRALELAERGLALSDAAGPFRTQLLIVTSRVRAELGDTRGAAEAIRSAREALAP